MDEKFAISTGGVELALRWDRGLRRNNNQDAYAIDIAKDEATRRTRGHLFMVADGMGAHAAGELASKLAADTIPLTYHKLHDQPAPSAIKQAVVDANLKIHRRGEANLDFHGMGTTASVLLLLPEGAVVAHVGDSRVYRLRGSRLDQLSFDHSLVWELMSSARMREEEVPNYIPKNVITRSLGPSLDVEVDLEGPFPIHPGDTYLLCSDGLTGQVKDGEIGAILNNLPPEEAATTLVDLANLRGGPDNITAVVVRVVELPNGAVAVADSHDEPPRPSEQGVRPRWFFAGAALVMLLAAIVTLLVAGGRSLLWIGFGLAAVLSTVIALWPRRATPNESEPGPPRLGRGPHTTRDCPAGPEFVGELKVLVEQLREGAVEEGWALDWPKFDGHLQLARKNADLRDFGAAVREYSRAISFLMSERKRLRAEAEGRTVRDGGR